jgi:tetratricopeptide (TPR) repeat protein
MGIRFHRSIGLGKLFRLNISKSGVGISAGLPGLRISTGPGGTYFTAGLPGTGLSYRQKVGGKKGEWPRRSSEPPPMKVQSLPAPGFFAPGHEKSLAKGLEAYYAGEMETALKHFWDAAPREAGAAIFAAAILSRQNGREDEAISLLESVLQSETEFPTRLMEKYLVGVTLEIEITPYITAAVPVEGLAAALLLVELYQAQGRHSEAIGLLEELEALAGSPVLTLSLCELYFEAGLWAGIIDRGQQVEPMDDVTLGIVIFYGRAMQEQKMHEAAILVYTKALRRKRNRAPHLLHEAMYWRAISYQEVGKKGRANQELQKIYAEAPYFRDVATLLRL